MEKGIRPRIRGPGIAVPDPRVKEFYDAAKTAAKGLVPVTPYPTSTWGQIAHKALDLAEARRDVDAGKAAMFAAEVVRAMMTA